MTSYSSHTPASPVVLNVDDAEPIRYTRSRVLTQAGYRVIEASTGKDAIFLAAAHRPELIVLDVRLPDVDGLQVCRQLKANPDTCHILVLQVSSERTSKMDLAAGMEGGADGYLVEPIDPMELLATVKALLRLAEREKENRRLIQQLSRSERQLIEATNAADCGMWDWDILSGKLEWFGAHERLAGMLPGGFNGKIEVFSEILHPEDRIRVWTALQQSMDARQEHFSDEYRFVHSDGSIHWMTGRGRFYYDEAGRAVRMTGVVQDITARKQAEAKLTQYRSIVAAATDGIAIIDRQARYIEQNLAHRAMLGYSDQDLIGQTPAIHAGEDKFADIAKELTDTGRCQTEMRSRRKDGQWVEIALSAFGIYDDKGDVLCYVGIKRDMTASKRAEEVTREAERRFHKMADSSPVLIWQTDVNGVTFVNRQYLDFFGQPLEAIAGMGWAQFLHPDDHEYLSVYRSAYEQRDAYEYQCRFRRHDGEYRWLKNVGTPHSAPDGEFVGFIGCSLDVTDIRQAEDTVRNSEAWLRALMSAMPQLVWTCAKDGRCTFLGSQWEAMTGQPESEALAYGWADMMHPDDRSRIMLEWEKAVELGLSFKTEYRLRSRDGGYRWYLVRAEALRDASGKIVQWIGTSTDIDDDKRREKALRESELRFRALADNISQLAWMTDEKGWLYWYNQRWFDYTGTTFDEMQGWGWQKVHHTDHLHRVVEKWRQALEAGETWEDTFPLRGRDGHYRWFLSRAVPIRDGNGHILHWFGTNTDITDLRAAEQAQAHLAAIVTSSDDAIISKDLNGIITTWNRGAERLFGYTEQEAVGRSVTILIPPERIDEEPRILDRIKHGESVEHYETIRRRKDGTLLNISLTVSPIRNEEGRIIGASKVARDITERKQHEEELQRWKDDLEVRVRERTTELLATQERLVAVTSQLSLTEQQERRKLARDLHDYLAQMLVVGQMKTSMMKKQVSSHPASAALLQDLDEVFQQALTYTRTLIAELSPPSLEGSGLPAALQWLGERFARDGLCVEVQASTASIPLPEEQAVVVFQAVRELLFNVMKHAGVDHAKITVTLNEHDILRVAVADRGKGSTPQELQGPAEPGHLGLASVRERFRVIGGRVEVESQPGQGTTVTLVLPLGEEKGERAKIQGKKSVERSSRLTPHTSPTIRVLLVDDHKLVRQGIRELLASEDRIRVVGEASTCEEALMLATNIAPDVMITDINLPGANGIELTTRLKKLHPEMVVIGLSVHDDELMKRTMISAGADALLSKECAAEELTTTITKIYNERFATGRTPHVS